MRTFAYIALIAGLGLALNLEAPPSAIAADLSLKAKKRIVHRHRVKIVRDYDGTPVAVRRVRPGMMRSYDTAWGWGWGSSWGTRRPDGRFGMYEHIPVEATPAYYLNGQPVLPHAKPRRYTRVSRLY